ncbi:MAG: crossover junction endodeoxyribonuclease RuvC [Acidimicrobiia bacterium]
MFVLGVDPGLTRCGFGVVERTGGSLRAVAAGVLVTPSDDPLPTRLAELQVGIRSVLAEHRPAAVAVERVFFQSNLRTAMSVGQASGVVLAEAAAAGCVVAQYTPSQVKASVTGSGTADKGQVQRMVQALLGLVALPRPADAADALALAICHHAAGPLSARVEAAGARRR